MNKAAHSYFELTPMMTRRDPQYGNHISCCGKYYSGVVPDSVDLMVAIIDARLTVQPVD